jgi:hypothetical protein
MKNTKNLIMVLTLILIFGLNCSLFQSGSADGMFAPGEVNKCIAALKKARGEKMKLLTLEVFAKYIVVQVQDSNKPENIDTFDYRNGTLSDPSPVGRYEGDSLDSQLFDPAEIALDKIPDLVKEIQERAKDLEGSKATRILIRRWNPSNQEVQMRIYVSGSRRSATMTVDQSGKVMDFKLD